MSNRVECEVFDTEIEGRPAVEAECTKCGHKTQSFGNKEPSVKRCLVLMREECPRGENNFYVEDDE